MTPLRKRMIDEMAMRNFSQKTIGLYVNNVARFARHFGKSPEQLGSEHVRRYLLYLVQEKKLAWGTYKQALAALLLSVDPEGSRGCGRHSLSPAGTPASGCSQL